VVVSPGSVADALYEAADMIPAIINNAKVFIFTPISVSDIMFLELFLTRIKHTKVCEIKAEKHCQTLVSACFKLKK